MDRTRGLLAGRKALVTGAGTGIGAAITRALAREGAQVCVTDLDLARANETAGAIGAAALALKLDVTSAAETRAALDQAAERLGGLDLVCANAGVSTMNRVEDLSEEEWDFNMDVNAKGVFLTDQAALRLFKRTGVKGVIVNTASLGCAPGCRSARSFGRPSWPASRRSRWPRAMSASLRSAGWKSRRMWPRWWSSSPAISPAT